MRYAHGLAVVNDDKRAFVLVFLQKKDPAGNEQKESLLTLLVQNVLKNPYIWGMALTYFFIYVVRQGVTSWFVFYLMKVRCRHGDRLPKAVARQIVSLF